MGADICCQRPHPKNTTIKPVVLPSDDHINFELIDKSEQLKIDEIIRLTVIEEKKYSLADFERVSRLGEGGFAIVDLVELKQNIKRGISIKYAMKQIPKKKLFERRVIENLKLEKKVLAELRNNFIIELKYSFQDKFNCYFVMEYASGGDVYSFMNNNRQPMKVQEFKRLGEVGPRFIIACVIQALECLHKQNIMYRDLKPENVLVFENGYPKLADFGLAKTTEGDELAKTMAGTKIYFAPQIVQRKGHTKNVDFWTLGVFLHQLITFETPFDPKDIMKTKFTKICQIAQTNRNWKGLKVSDEAKDLINAFLRVEPTERLGVNGFDQIKCHPFFKDFDWAKLNRTELASPLREIVKKYPNKLKQIIPQTNQDGQQYEHIENLTYQNRGINK